MIEELKNQISIKLNNKIKEEYGVDVELKAETPKNKENGDVAIPAFPLCKTLKKSPIDSAQVVAHILEELGMFETINMVGGYVNATYSREVLSREVLESLGTPKKTESPKTYAIDFSSPNIAKPFFVGHLRTTVIGYALSNILSYRGHSVVRINHLGDFGTQFGKLIYAFENWGSIEEVRKNPIDTLVGLYVRFNQEAKLDPALDDEARRIFKELESGDEHYRTLWKEFKEYSLAEFNRVYKNLGVSFDVYSSEAEASRKSQRVISMLREKGLLVKDAGAEIVRLKEPLPPAIVIRSDGATLYITRDLEEIWDRYDKYHFDYMLYCVGNEQKLYFTQLKEVLKLMNAPFSEGVKHVNNGLILKDGKKMATRDGSAVKLDDVLTESITLARAHIEEKNPTLENKDELAKKIGVSAIIFNDLKNYRENDYEFDIDQATRFEGQTGPYIQYTDVRIKSILNQCAYNKDNIDYSLFKTDSMYDMVKALDAFEDVIDKCISEYAPNYLAKYLLNLSTLFNSFYAKEKVLCENIKERDTKLYLLSKIKDVIETGLSLLSMSIVDKM